MGQRVVGGRRHLPFMRSLHPGRHGTWGTRRPLLSPWGRALLSITVVALIAQYIAAVVAAST